MNPRRPLLFADAPGHDPGMRPSMPRVLARFAVAACGLLAAAVVFGFALFAANVMRPPAGTTEAADGILVLTGGDFRISEGARLLQAGQANRMLISGVNARTTRDDLLRLTGLSPAAFDCCVELGYAAQDTVGNAEEARTWVKARGLSRLIVVTSSYHMPRSLAELSLALPGLQMIPDAVVPPKFREPAWWLHPGAARVLLSEYIKYLPVAGKLWLSRLRAQPQDAANG